jgi:coenzyme F420-0:L-glutamate ligase/coenzyme F420-1:gamma-L-glutamate ligase
VTWNCWLVPKLEVWPVEGLPEIEPGDDLGALISGVADLEEGDTLVVAQKVISKAEGRLLDLNSVEVGPRASELAATLESDPRILQVVLNESQRVVRSERVLIVETHHGFICANAGVDHSNVPGKDNVCLLPLDPDASAGALRRRILEVTGANVGVIISDTFGRPWRVGLTNVALGVSGMAALVDYRGQADDHQQELQATVIAIADELAGMAELVMGKTRRIPAALIRGGDWTTHREGTARDLIRPADMDLFR